MPRDYYEILGVDRRVNETELKRAFRKLAQKYHPDVSKEPDAENRFKEINEAYQVLSDPQRRRAYDQFGHAGVNFGAGGGGFSGFAGFEDIMEDLFSTFGGGMRNNRRGRRPRQGRDLRYDLRLGFEQALFGDDVEIEVTRWELCPDCEGNGAAPGTSPTSCPDCNGTGQVSTVRQTFLGTMRTVTDCPRCEGSGEVVDTPCATCKGKGRVRKSRSLNVNIPPGVDDGTQIRLTGEGEPGEHGGPPGNLYIVLKVDDHNIFTRRGSDVILNININVAQAALGDTVDVPLPGDQKESIRIEAGTQTGTVLKLKGKGVPKLRPDGRSSGNGDFLVVVNVAIPTKLTADQRALFEQLGHSLGTELVAENHNRGFLERMAHFFSGE